MRRGLIAVIGVVTLSSLFMAGGFVLAADVEKPADFYKGKTLNMVLLGGGTNPDILIRAIAPSMGKYTGANSRVMEPPGMGGIATYSYLFREKPTGLIIGAGSLGAMMNQIMEPGRTPYDMRKMSLICGYGWEKHVFLVSPDGLASIAELKKLKNIKLVAAYPSGNLFLSTASAIHLLDLDAKVITGVKFTDTPLGIKRGEFTGACLTIGNAAYYTRQGLVKPLFIISSRRDPAFPDTPAITELIPPLAGEKKELFDRWDKEIILSWLFMGPPGRFPKIDLHFCARQAGKFSTIQRAARR